MNKYFATLKAAARELGLSQNVLYGLIESKLIATTKIGNSPRQYISHAELARFKAEHAAV